MQVGLQPGDLLGQGTDPDRQVGGHRGGYPAVVRIARSRGGHVRALIGLGLDRPVALELGVGWELAAAVGAAGPSTPDV